MSKRKIKRGDIYYADLGYAVGSEQGNIRPVLVVSNDTGNRFSPTIVITPITSKLHKTELPTHVPISRSCGLDRDSLVLVEQIRAIDRSRIEEYVGSIDNDCLKAIDKALGVCVGLKIRRRTRRGITGCLDTAEIQKHKAAIRAGKDMDVIEIDSDIVNEEMRNLAAFAEERHASAFAQESHITAFVREREEE